MLLLLYTSSQYALTNNNVCYTVFLFIICLFFRCIIFPFVSYKAKTKTLNFDFLRPLWNLNSVLEQISAASWTFLHVHMWVIPNCHTWLVCPRNLKIKSKTVHPETKQQNISPLFTAINTT